MMTDHEIPSPASGQHARRELVIALVAMLAPSAFAFCYFVLFTHPVVSRVFYYASRAYLLLLPMVWWLFVLKRRFPLPRLKREGIRAGIVSGICMGLTALVLYINVFQEFGLLPTEAIRARADSLGFGDDIFVYFAFYIVTMNSGFEEYYWRWFTFVRLREAFPLWRAIVL
jgi:hypothetical protein